MVIIRPATSEDMAAIQRVCEQVLDLEPDAGELPGILMRRDGYLTLVAESMGGAGIQGVCFGSLGRVPSQTLGYIDLLAVKREAQGHGIGKRLLTATEDLLHQQGANVVQLSGNPPVYVWPGVDPRYTVMTCLAERAGYEKLRDSIDMAVDLNAIDLDTTQAEQRLAAAGIEVRQASADEKRPIDDWLRTGPWRDSGWPDEVAQSLDRSGCHVAVRDERYIGFACYGANRHGWFGPMGTDPEERRHGIGTVLLKRCLADMQSAGLETARIGWVGPVGFYARVLKARVERVYWFYRKALLYT